MPIARRLADLLRGLRDRVEVAPEVGAPAADEAPDDVRLDALRVIELAETGWEIVLVDLRPVSEQGETGVPAGARRVGVAAAMAGEVLVPEDGHAVFVCANGRRSEGVALALRAAGHDRVWSLDGGLRAWLAAGGPVEPA
jgi:rhodanese-related sulfurtransferase